MQLFNRPLFSSLVEYLSARRLIEIILRINYQLRLSKGTLGNGTI